MGILSIDNNTAYELLPKRPAESNKGTFGKALIVCGSEKAVGCCVLNALGALRSGCGLVELAIPDVIYPQVSSRLAEPIFLPLKSDDNGCISSDSVGEILRHAEEADVVLCGCGLGTRKGARDIVEALVTLNDKPLVIDADGINCLSKIKNVIFDKKCDILITPHPGEFSRFTGLDIEEIQKNREAFAVKVSQKYGITVLLKGNNTVVSNKTGEKTYINTTGNSGLAKGGSGDLLAGIIASLSIGTGDLFTAASLGAYIHGMTADILKDTLTEYSMLPTDCADAIPLAFRKITAGR